MKASLRLAFSAVVVSFITLAASGKPLPFLTAAPDASDASAVKFSGAPPALPAAFSHFDRQ